MWMVKIGLTLVSVSGIFVVLYQLATKRTTPAISPSPNPSVVEVPSSPLPTQSPMTETKPVSSSPQASPRFSPSVQPSPLASAAVSPRPRHDEREGEDD